MRFEKRKLIDFLLSNSFYFGINISKNIHAMLPRVTKSAWENQDPSLVVIIKIEILQWRSNWPSNTVDLVWISLNISVWAYFGSPKTYNPIFARQTNLEVDINSFHLFGPWVVAYSETLFPCIDIQVHRLRWIFKMKMRSWIVFNFYSATKTFK